MKAYLEKEYFLSASDANAEGELSLTALASNIIDIATNHANSLGIGNPSMADINAGWILSRITIDMEEVPKMNTTYILSTWIEDFNRYYSARCFKISSKDGKVYGYCRTIWLVIDAETHKNLGLSHFNLSPELISGEKAPIPIQEKHIPIFENADKGVGKFILATHPPFHYKFKYCDLDAYRHVNTVRYFVLLLNQFTLEEHDATRVKRIELSFLHEACYGMETELLRSDSTEDSMVSSFQLADSKTKQALLFSRVKRVLKKP